MTAFEKGIRESNRQLTFRGLIPENLARLAGSKPDGVVFLGIGGSALAGEIVKSLRSEIGLKVPVIVWRDYGLPDLLEYKLKRPLYVTVSFSGNTEEPLSGLAQLLKSRRRPALAAVAAGGALADTARKEKLPWVTFPHAEITQPRVGTGRMFWSILAILRAARLIPARDYDFTSLDPMIYASLGKSLAGHLKKRVVLVYTDEARRSLGYIWKIKLNETGKNEAFLNVLPEMNHNELVGLQKHHFPLVALFLTEPAKGSRMAKRIAINRQLLEQRKIPTFELPLEGKTELERVWRTIMLADWTSFKLGQLNGEDPERVEIVEELKHLMKK